MPRYREWDLACKVYVGNLGSSASKYEIENAFSKYGPLRNVWVARNPPGFAFVEFEDRRDAEDATRGLDGTLKRTLGANFNVVSPIILQDKVFFFYYNKHNNNKNNNNNNNKNNNNKNNNNSYYYYYY
ncbi:hypothetical protein KR032_003618 [Drosophila birchii]|nr:hypothetical protein KR032_003618 [Drosophila birchii]